MTPQWRNGETSSTHYSETRKRQATFRRIDACNAEGLTTVPSCFISLCHYTFTLGRPLLPYGPIKHPVADRVKPSFVIFDIRAL